MPRPLVPEGASFTFADFFKLRVDAREVVAHFGCTMVVKPCELPHKELDREALAAMKSRMEQDLPFVSLTSETARREFLIAPVIMEAVHHTHAHVQVEYPLEVDEQLKGTVDYFLRAPQGEMLVVEAKQGDLQRGFNQLAVELIALDRWLEETEPKTLWGAVSMGDAWRFGFLDREAALLTQDLHLYPVPDDLERLLGILVAILGG
ncbi:MAG: hypothetical protein GY856_32765 [bacterium]|nr:hypothetical protein [bacterium]